MDGNYKMSQTDMHAFAIHDKPGGAFRATIERTPDGAWSTHPAPDAATTAPAVPDFDEQKSAQAAFDAFIAWADSPAG